MRAEGQKGARALAEGWARGQKGQKGQFLRHRGQIGGALVGLFAIGGYLLQKGQKKGKEKVFNLFLLIDKE